MRIISKFHDYYDTAMGHGIDMSCLYERNTVARIQKDLPSILNKTRRSNFYYPLRCSYSRFPYFDDHGIVKYYSTKIRDDGFEALPVIIGYCGRFYLGYRIKGYIEGYFYDYKSLSDFFADHNIEFTDKEMGCFKKAFDEKLNDVPYLLDFFHECNAPVIVYVLRVKKNINYTHHDGYDYIINPCLKDFEFYKVFDAYTAY